MRIKSARFVICTGCHSQFIICSDCDRGNIYCGTTCSSFARQKFMKLSGKRYQTSPNGRRHHAHRQRLYIMRKKNKVTHQGSQLLPFYDSLPILKNNQIKYQARALTVKFYCCFCGESCSDYVRQVLLRQSSGKKHLISSIRPHGP